MKNIQISDFGYESGKEKVRIQMRKQNPTDRDIEKLVDKSDDMISIMPGSKLRSSNIELFLKNNRIRDYHSSCYINGKFSIEEARLINTKIKNF